MPQPTPYKISFVEGNISTHKMTEAMQVHHELKHSGAWNIFIGQVRADQINERTVGAIEYTCYEEMAEQSMVTIIDECSREISIDFVHILHSKGAVKAGEICLFVAVACGHRKESFRACELIVERLKKETPIWGKEIFEDKSHQWKVNN